ncbi:hypothetical protein [Roseobacter sp. HKCCA0434]|uniref:hypothetical protein n=1 Tax=Roseobacter sp. HKCCA0434 TaxID=3079297 RepID=UPI002905A454|nr:hypothetical protein [Roseobacter sp. HKCCA0434]
MGSLKIGLIAYCAYVVGGVSGWWIFSIFDPFEGDDYLTGGDPTAELILVIFAVVFGSIMTLTVVSYFLLPSICRRITRSDRMAMLVYFALIQAHGFAILVLSTFDTGAIFIFSTITALNLWLLVTFLRRPDLHRDPPMQNFEEVF